MEALMIKYSWQKDSLCQKELKFIPETGEYVPYTVDDFYLPIGKGISKEVKAMCRRCPAQNDCLEHALAHEKYGYWGGTSEKQRITMRSKRGIKCYGPRTVYE